MSRIKLPALAWFAILFAITAVLGIIVPANPSSLHALGIDESIYRLLIFTILIPYGLAWGAAFYAYEALGSYAATIADTVEGRGFARIVRGLRVLAWGIVLAAMLSGFLGLIRYFHPSFVGAQTAINHYATLIVALVSFVYIQDGTYILVESLRIRRSKSSIRGLIIVATIIGALLIELVDANFGSNDNPYYLPFPVLLITVLIPYIIAWTIGILGTSELRTYARRVNGIIYQRALQTVATSLTLVIAVSIITQYFSAIFARKTSFELGPLLIFVYILLLIEAGAFVWLALGAKKLKQIEDA